mmetsp:Transcript_49096/g.106609  ORF Transcript_49096/g.106609 Transcript_49096/m.106609 type:complete len:91 (+) Transcript_49096:1-273(+)
MPSANVVPALGLTPQVPTDTPQTTLHIISPRHSTTTTRLYSHVTREQCQLAHSRKAFLAWCLGGLFNRRESFLIQQERKLVSFDQTRTAT